METLQYKLQQFDPGVVWLDRNNIVTGLNSVAMDVLGQLKEHPIGINIIKFHPEKSQEKVEMLLRESQCPMDSPPPVSMMINAIDRLLMIKVSKMYGADGILGTCMIFYDLTDVASGVESDPPLSGESLSLKKLPVYKNNRIILVDLEKVIYIKAEGHYCSLHTVDNEYLCNLSLSDLETTLFMDSFKRVHRSFIVNLKEVYEIEKKDKDFLLKVVAKESATIPVGRNNHSLVKQYFNLN